MTIHRLFIRCENPLTISTIILQSSCSNLINFIRPLTNLDNVLSGNIDSRNKIRKNDRDVKVLKGLFDAYLAGHEYAGNQYVWNIFNAFVNHKHKLDIKIGKLESYCKNKALIGLILSERLKKGEYAAYSARECGNKNLLKREIISIFKNVTYIEIGCLDYPLSLESLLSLINDTQITTVKIIGNYWSRKLKGTPLFRNMERKYKESNFKLQFAAYNNLIIEKLKE